MNHAVVIGGGVAGLATAALLGHRGYRVRLLEKNARVGGRVGTVSRDGFRFETGPSWYLMPEVFDHFFELLGTSTREQFGLTPLDPGYRVFTQPGRDGAVEAPVTVPFGAERVAELFEELEPGAGDRLRSYLGSAAEANAMAMRYFLYNPFTRLSRLATAEVLRAAPRLVGLLTTSLETFIAKHFRHPVLRQILGYPAVFLGTSPAAAPAMYHLMSGMDLEQGVHYPEGGFGNVIDRLERLAVEAGVEVTTQAEVTRITCRRYGRRQRVTGVQWRDADGVEHTEHAGIVVSGADLHHTETELLGATARSYPEDWWRDRVSGPGAVIAMLGVTGELPQLTHHSLFFTRDWNANFTAILGPEPVVPDPASLYVCKPSATDSGVAPPGHENLFVLIPVPAQPGIGSGGADGTGDSLVEHTVDAAIDQIAQWADIPDLRERIVVRETIGPADFVGEYNSWRGGMLGPAHTLRQSALFRAQNQSRKVSGLYYAGATTAPGIGVPMCLISAELVVKRIRRDHSPGPSSDPEWTSR